MAIQVKCGCGKQVAVPEKFAGKKVKCPACSQTLQVPPAAGSGQTAKSASDEPTKIDMACGCGKTFRVNVSLAGKMVKCPECGEPLTVTAPKTAEAATSQQSGKSAGPPRSGIEALFDELGIGSRDGGAGRRCPECKAAMATDAIICIECGYNEELGRRMTTRRPVTQADRGKKGSKK